MPTINQLVKNPRVAQKRKPRSPALMGCPQKRGVVLRISVVKPKKPNSANRAVARVKLTNGKTITAYIPGEGTPGKVQEHSSVLIRGGGPPDLPGVKYRLVCGVLDLLGGSPGHDVPRKQGRSQYGVKRQK